MSSIKNFFKIILFILSFIFSIQYSFARGVLLPKPNGKYSVGVKEINFCDSNVKFSSNSNCNVRIFYPAEKHDDSHVYILNKKKFNIVSYIKENAEPLKNKKFPLIIFLPAIDDEKLSYSILCSKLASQGNIVANLDLSIFKTRKQGKLDEYTYLDKPINRDQKSYNSINFEPSQDDLKIIINLIDENEFFKTHSIIKNKAFIGIEYAATLIKSTTDYDKFPLISVLLDKDGFFIMSEGLLDRNILIFNDPKSSNTQDLKNWVKAMNNQQALVQQGKKPFYKEWVTVKDLPLSSSPSDALYISSKIKGNKKTFDADKLFNDLTKEIEDWLKKVR